MASVQELIALAQAQHNPSPMDKVGSSLANIVQSFQGGVEHYKKDISERFDRTLKIRELEKTVLDIKLKQEQQRMAQGLAQAFGFIPPNPVQEHSARGVATDALGADANKQDGTTAEDRVKKLLDENDITYTQSPSGTSVSLRRLSDSERAARAKASEGKAAVVEEKVKTAEVTRDKIKSEIAKNQANIAKTKAKIAADEKKAKGAGLDMNARIKLKKQAYEAAKRTKVESVKAANGGFVPKGYKLEEPTELEVMQHLPAVAKYSLGRNLTPEELKTMNGASVDPSNPWDLQRPGGK